MVKIIITVWFGNSQIKINYGMDVMLGVSTKLIRDRGAQVCLWL